MALIQDEVGGLIITFEQTLQIAACSSEKGWFGLQGDHSWFRGYVPQSDAHHL